jgi:hypothetical protein
MNMTQRQRFILAASLAVLVIMCLFPPWQSRVDGYEISFLPGSYALIFLAQRNAQLDLVRLTIQVMAVVAATGAALLLVRPGFSPYQGSGEKKQ